MATNTKILRKKQKGDNRHWKNFLDKDYLGSHNLEKGEEMLLTIAKFEGEEEVQTEAGKTMKPVIYFKEDVPKLIMNITNGNTITALYGSHPEDWKGKQIQIYSTPVKAFGSTHDALRIRDFIPKIDVDIDAYTSDLMEATTLEELKAKWVKFSASVRNNEDMIAAKDELKAQLV